MNFKRIKDMAYQRSQFISRSGDRFKQAVTHIALIIYGNTYLDNCTTINHWVSEVKSFLDPVLYDELRQNNSSVSRLKAFRAAIEEADLFQSRNFNGRLALKFDNEDIDVPDDFYARVLPIVQEQFNQVIEELAYINPRGYKRWLESLKTLSL